MAAARARPLLWEFSTVCTGGVFGLALTKLCSSLVWQIPLLVLGLGLGYLAVPLAYSGVMVVLARRRQFRLARGFIEEAGDLKALLRLWGRVELARDQGRRRAAAVMNAHGRGQEAEEDVLWLSNTNNKLRDSLAHGGFPADRLARFMPDMVWETDKERVSQAWSFKERIDSLRNDDFFRPVRDLDRLSRRVAK